MKTQLTLLILLFSLQLGLMAQKDSSLAFVTFSSSKSVTKARALFIDLHKTKDQLIKQKLSSCKAVKHLKISGSVADSTWNTLFTECARLPWLKSVEISSSNIETLPPSFYSLKNIEDLKIEDCDILDWNSFFTNWNKLNSLKNAELALWSLNEISGKNAPPPHLQNFNLTENYFNEDELEKTKEPYNYHFESEKKDEKVAISIQTENENRSAIQKMLSNLTGGMSLGAASDKAVAKAPVANKKQGKIFTTVRGALSNTESFTYNPSKGGFYFTRSGTTVSVPANAFCYENGKPVKDGMVDVDVSEYKSVADIIVHQIPMQLDSGKQNYQLETAGMLSIRAFADDKPLVLAPNKSLLINFSSIDSTNNFNLYSFNDSTKAWNSTPALKAVDKTKATKKDTAKQLPYTSACKYFNYLVNYDGRPRDTTNYLNRFYSRDYVNDLSMQYFEKKKWRNYNIYPSSYKKVFRLVKTRKTADTNIVFMIAKPRHDLNRESYPYINSWWKLDEDMDARKFRKTYAYGKKYNDMRVTDEGGTNTITLKTENGYVHFKAHPVMVSANNKVMEYRDHGVRTYKRYQRRLVTEGKSFARRLKREKTHPNYDNKFYYPRKKFTKEEAFAESRNKMNKDERKMSLSQWMTYYDKVLSANRGFAWYAWDNPLNRAFTASKLGIYNCDRIMKMERPVDVFVKYVDSTGTEILPATSYVYYKKARSVWGFYGTNNFSISSANQNELFIIGTDGNYYRTSIVKEAPIPSLGKELVLNVSSVKLEGKNDSEISKLLGIN